MAGLAWLAFGGFSWISIDCDDFRGSGVITPLPTSDSSEEEERGVIVMGEVRDTFFKLVL